MEIHISADVAYAVWQYWQIQRRRCRSCTQAGAEILLETARFWASAGHRGADGYYHLRHVIGPDEYHEDVDDNAYTNLMAAWNLRRSRGDGADIWRSAGPNAGRNSRNVCEITPEELRSWSHLADVMYTGFDPNTRLFEQFQGFYQKEGDRPASRMSRATPPWT